MDRRKKNIIELTRCSVSGYHGIPKLPIILFADNVRSMHNVGSFFRTADAFLFDRIILAGISGRPPHPEISKTALGAEESVEWEYAPDAFSRILSLKEEGWVICSLEQTHNSIPLQDFVPQLEGEGKPRGYVIVAGNEVEGVDQRIVDASDVVLEIPQCGVKHSLNVSVSAGIAMWHFFSHSGAVR